MAVTDGKWPTFLGTGACGLLFAAHGIGSRAKAQSVDERCYNCRFFLPAYGAAVMPETSFSPGSCRRHAPPHPPEIKGEYWCGDWEFNVLWAKARAEWLDLRKWPTVTSTDAQK